MCYTSGWKDYRNPKGCSKVLCEEDLVSTSMTQEHQRTAKARLVAMMNQGQSWQEATASVGLPMSRATAYRLQRRVRLEGETALDDHRHGHVFKLREPMRQWVVTYCQQAPHTPSHLLQVLLCEQFHVNLSIGYLNQVRAKLGVRYARPRQGKKP